MPEFRTSDGYRLMLIEGVGWVDCLDPDHRDMTFDGDLKTGPLDDQDAPLDGSWTQEIADFYTDTGRVVVLKDDAGRKRSIGRYGAWLAAGSRKPEVVLTADYLDDLKKIYGDLPMAEIKR